VQVFQVFVCPNSVGVVVVLPYVPYDPAPVAPQCPHCSGTMIAAHA
jgi:hypothetical protein